MDPRRPGDPPPPQSNFIQVYKIQAAPWDTGRPQPAVIAAFERGLLTGHVLDLGTGTGDNAVWLGKHGLAVTGLDLSGEAVAIANKRLAEAGVEAVRHVTFKQADASELRPVLGTQQFDTALDSAVLHCLPLDLRPVYIRSLTPHIRQGGKMVLLAFSYHNQDPWNGPSRVNQAELQGLFNQVTGWRIESIEDTSSDYELGGPESKHPGFSTKMCLMTAIRL